MTSLTEPLADHVPAPFEHRGRQPIEFAVNPLDDGPMLSAYDPRERFIASRWIETDTVMEVRQ